MEKNKNATLSHKKWRCIAKKERRRHIRQKIAQQREADDERLRATLVSSAEYLNWISEQKRLEDEEEKEEIEERKKQHQLWLEAEIKAQKEWKEIEERKAKARHDQLMQEEIIRREFEAKRDQLIRRQNQELQRREELEKQINDYIDHGTQTPETLRLVTDSQPNKELCPFFSKTGACKYGDTCSRNHRKCALSKIIIIPGFYTHFSLEKTWGEYDTDIALEFESSETRRDFREFYREIVPELESFGRIKTLKCCCNSEIHLRGNLYIEYYTEREAARAWRKLRGRYYAGRQLNCEFVTLISWNNAICGMTKCPKGRACNFLHTFRNPGGEYDIKSPSRWCRRSKNKHSSGRKNSLTSDELAHDNEDWGWSSSPESWDERQERNSSVIKRTSRHKSWSNTGRSSERKKSKSSKDKKLKTRHRSHLDSDKKYKNNPEKVKKHRSTANNPSDMSPSKSSDSSQMEKKQHDNEWDTTDSEDYK